MTGTKKRRKDPLAVRFGRRGGRARAAKMTREERSALGRKAVQARWAKERARKQRTTNPGAGAVARRLIKKEPPFDK
jgi:hypothetical protein